MGNFLENLWGRLEKAGDGIVLREIRGDQFVDLTAKQLLERVARARGFLRELGLQNGDRCALLGPNSMEWVAVDLALMAEGAIVVPLYASTVAIDEGLRGTIFVCERCGAGGKRRERMERCAAADLVLGDARREECCCRAGFTKGRGPGHDHLYVRDFR